MERDDADSPLGLKGHRGRGCRGMRIWNHLPDIGLIGPNFIADMETIRKRTGQILSSRRVGWTMRHRLRGPGSLSDLGC